MIYLNWILTNPYLEEDLVSTLVWPEISYVTNWSVIISGQSTEDMIPDIEFGMTQYA